MIGIKFGSGRLKEREGEIKEEGKKKEEERKKKKKKELSPESNLGPLIRDSGRYTYKSEGAAGRYSKRAWGEHCFITHTLP